MYRCLCTAYVSSVDITMEFPHKTKSKAAVGVSCPAFHSQQVCKSLSPHVITSIHW